ncbi:hypothetical protein ACFY93_24185 [Streptomyces sp. NPDC008313]|uniref:hypothetical protein n=1 Tax=Streptomyces sp. NPDC008313 TaxID=3364826 RepID=UPI0036E298E6
MLRSGRSRGGSGEWEQPFWQQRGWIASAGFLLVLLVIAAVVLVRGGDGDESTGASGDPSPKPGATSGKDKDKGKGKGREADGRPAGCHTDDSDQDKPTKAPKDFRWKADGTGLVPVSKTAGPLKYDGPVWSCFAHTPMGAVLAAHAITDHLSYPGWREVVDRQVVPGAGRDALISDRSKAEDKPTSGKPDVGGYAGFSVLAYNKKEATLMFLLRGPGSSYGSTSVSMRWQDGDWKLAPDTDGTIYAGMSKVTGTQGFVSWEA